MSKPEKRSKSEWVVKVMTHATWAPHIPHVLDLELKALPAANRPLATWQWSRRRMPDGMEMEEGELSMYAHVLVVLYPRVTGVQLTSSIRACGAPAPKGLSENDWCEWWCDHVLKTTLSDLRRLHELGYVHGDIKPDNMATKWTGEASHVCVHDIPLSNPDADVHLVDLDLATPFRGDAWNMERARAWSADDDVPRALWELYAPTYRPPELWVVPHTIGCSPFPGMDVYAWAMSMCLILARVSPSTAPRFMTAAADALNWKVPHAPRDPLTHATMNVCALLHPTHVKAYAQHVGELVEAEGEDYPDAQLPEQHTVQWLKKSRTTTWCPAAAFEEDLWSPHPLDMKGDERCKQLDDVWDMSVPDLYPGWFMRPRRVTVLRWMRWRAWYLEQCATHAEAHKLVDKQGWIASIMETMMQRTTGRTRRKMQAVWSILKRALAPNPALRWYNSQDVWEALEKHHVFTSS
jgi:serine/threonine protein kinase